MNAATLTHRSIGGALLIACALSPAAFARTPITGAAAAADDVIEEREFMREYAMGVHRIPIDGGKIYGWKLNDRVTFGRLKGENDKFGFSVDMNRRHRVEITTDGIRWRRALGGSSEK
jgi:hypothetical protein